MPEDELVEWLRSDGVYEGRAFLQQAADCIEALEAENERLREALRNIDAWGDEWAASKARAALAGEQ